MTAPENEPKGYLVYNLTVGQYVSGVLDEEPTDEEVQAFVIVEGHEVEVRAVCAPSSGARR